jgi:hypothetical protein
MIRLNDPNEGTRISALNAFCNALASSRIDIRDLHLDLRPNDAPKRSSPYSRRFIIPQTKRDSWIAAARSVDGDVSFEVTYDCFNSLTFYSYVRQRKVADPYRVLARTPMTAIFSTLELAGVFENKCGFR